jgi:anti-sigma regulatory factor (Ser/Thr protein kinase)
MSAVSITITNAASELERVAALADEFAAAHGLSSDVIADLQVALDEVLTNIIKYGYTDHRVHEISVQLSVEDGTLVGKIEDDGRPFDPLKVPEPDVKAPLRERGIGGVGIHFLRKLMSEVSYRRLADRNRLEFRKNFRA